MEACFDALVVGSGFGGGASALRLAEAGASGSVLALGKRWPPGSFTRSPMEMWANLWDPSEGHHGLFDIRSCQRIEAVVSVGLGGGSLIYANVLLRQDESGSWVTGRPGYEYWPVAYDGLGIHHTTSVRMLGAERYPSDLDLDIDWATSTSSSYFERLRSTQRVIATPSTPTPSTVHRGWSAGSSPSTRSAGARWAATRRKASSRATARCSATPVCSWRTAR